MNNFIEVFDATKSFDDGAIKALDGVNVSIGKGEFVSIMGPSGCGKSTLLNMIGALDVPTSGKIVIDGKNLSEFGDLAEYRSKKIGFVFQLHNLIPSLSALENVQVPMFSTKLSRKQRLAKAKKLLRLVGLEERDNNLPNKLSGGQRQKVAIARALANDPEILIADEPTGSLDSKSGETVLKLLEQVHHEQGVTIILVTHDQRVGEAADRMIRMLDGRIV
jgi:putative ABC transport system ATP-binding protein